MVRLPRVAGADGTHQCSFYFFSDHSFSVVLASLFVAAKYPFGLVNRRAHAPIHLLLPSRVVQASTPRASSRQRRDEHPASARESEPRGCSVGTTTPCQYRQGGRGRRRRRLRAGSRARGPHASTAAEAAEGRAAPAGAPQRRVRLPLWREKGARQNRRSVEQRRRPAAVRQPSMYVADGFRTGCSEAMKAQPPPHR